LVAEYPSPEKDSGKQCRRISESIYQAYYSPLKVEVTYSSETPVDSPISLSLQIVLCIIVTLFSVSLWQPYRTSPASRLAVCNPLTTCGPAMLSSQPTGDKPLSIM
jgi:hypothetical protein